MRLDVAACTDVGRVRQNNEDAYATFRIGRYLERFESSLADDVLPKRREEFGTVLMVADGMGGMAAGELASHTVLETWVKLLLDSPKWTLHLEDPRTRADEIDEMWAAGRAFVAAAHAAVLARAAQDPSLAGMGTTLTAAFQLGGDLFVLHVGDSCAYLLRDGHFEKITRDHTLAQSFIEQGMNAEDAEARGFHHVLTQSVGGVSDEPNADMHGLRVAHGDRILLCTDGLTNELSDPEIAAALGAGKPSRDIARELVDLALQHGARDNVTVIVVGIALERDR